MAWSLAVVGLGLALAFGLWNRRLSRALKKRDLQAVQAEKLSLLGEMVAGVAHEVKNPMVGIVGFSQLGIECTSLDEAREFFKLIEGDAQRANAILHGLLDFARPGERETARLEVNAVATGALRLVEAQLRLKGVTVGSKLAPGLPAIEGNDNHLRQVLLNLMMNAGQALEGRPYPRVDVETGIMDGEVFIRVKDNGPGMPPAVRTRVFDPFFTTKARGKGTGLGLSISKTIVEQHGGRLRVESVPGEGATFWLQLPPANP